MLVTQASLRGPLASAGINFGQVQQDNDADSDTLMPGAKMPPAWPD